MSETILQSKRGTELDKLTRDELRVVATKLNISGRWNMNKRDLVEAILRAEAAEVGNANNAGGVQATEQSAKDECKVDNQANDIKNVEVETKVENKSAGVHSIDFEQKMRYVENIEIGTIVAFRLSNGKVKSAKVVKKSTKNRKLKLETDYGAEYIVPYDSVVWVRTGKRWPKGVYNLLKGTVRSDSE